MSKWKRSSRCDSNKCVEVATTDDGILIRDSKDKEGPVLTFTPDEWNAFILGAKADEFDI